MISLLLLVLSCLDYQANKRRAAARFRESFSARVRRSVISARHESPLAVCDARMEFTTVTNSQPFPADHQRLNVLIGRLHPKKVSSLSTSTTSSRDQHPNSSSFASENYRVDFLQPNLHEFIHIHPKYPRIVDNTADLRYSFIPTLSSSPPCEFGIIYTHLTPSSSTQR